MSIPPPPSNPTGGSPTVKPSYDPGWNDPPMLAYTPAGVTPTAAASKPKLLNKRIAFPIQSNPTSTTNVQTSDAGLPMPFARVQHQPPPPLGFAPPPAAPEGGPPQLPPTCVPSVAPVQAPTEVIESEPETSSEQMCDETLLRLRNVLAGVSLEPERKTELEKRLALLSNAWMEAHLDARLQQRIRDLSLALESNDRLTEATELHRSLAVDYGTVSAPWAASLRQLIIARQPPSDHEQQSVSVEPAEVANVLLDTNSVPAAFVPGQVHHI